MIALAHLVVLMTARTYKGGPFPRPDCLSVAAVAVFGLVLAAAGGCGAPTRGPTTFYLDGAGWYSSAGSVQQGLRQGGYNGQFHTFSWSAYLGPAHDHFVTAKSKAVARSLARQMEKLRRNDPQAQINVMGLSASSAVILSALEQLPAGIEVDNVVLLSPSVSSEHDLTKAMQHVRQRLYATSSPHDGILGTLPATADGKSGPPAGRTGFRMLRRGDTSEAAYRKVINLPWQPGYLAFDWDGGHTSVTNAGFVAAVIAPRVLSAQPYPLDRSVAEFPATTKASGDRP